jgi:hypothetical protein
VLPDERPVVPIVKHPEPSFLIIGTTGFFQSTERVAGTLPIPVLTDGGDAPGVS